MLRSVGLALFLSDVDVALFFNAIGEDNHARLPRDYRATSSVGWSLLVLEER